jgi:hypothetical protein
MDVFVLVAPSGEPLDVQTASERHGFAPLLLAIFAAAATIVVIFSGSRPAAVAVAAAGGVALVLLLTIDAPDLNSVGNFEDRAVGVTDARAEPRAGFWLEMVGALGLTICGSALAMLTPERRTAPARALEARRRGQGDQ